MNDDDTDSDPGMPPRHAEEEEAVPGTQFSHRREEEEEEPATPRVAPSSRRGLLFSTPAKRPVASQRRGGSDDDDDDDDDDEDDVVAQTPAVPSSVRKPWGGVAGASGGAGGGGGDDDDEDDDDDDFDWRGGGGGGGNDGDDASIDGDGHDGDDANDDGEDAHGGDDFDGEAEAEAEAEDPATLIRGTDVHVQSAAAAFRDFVRNFVSVEESERRLARERRMTRRRRRRGGAGGRGRAAAAAAAGDDGDGDDVGDDDSDSDSEDDDEERDDEIPPPLYLRRLEQILLRGRSDSTPDSLTSSAASAGTGRVGVASLDLDALHLHFHSPECQRLYGWLVDYPSEIVPLMDILLGRELETLRDEMRLAQEGILAEAEANGDELGAEVASGILELLPDDVVLPRVQVRPFHLRSLSHMRSLDPNSIDSLMGLRGMVVRTSPVIPDLKVAFFQCRICGHADQVTIDRGRIAEPTQCPTCHVRHGFALVHNRCYFSDKQMVRVQETPDEVPAGETPASIVVFAYDDLVDAVRPGDRVEVTGVFRAQARRVNPKITKVKSVYKTYVDAIHFRKVVTNSSRERDEAVDAAAASIAAQSKKKKKKKKTADDDDEEESGAEKDPPGRGSRGDDVTHGSHFPPVRIAELVALSRMPDVYDRLVKALAPSIWEMDDVKKGVLCMLFGGNSRKVKKGTAQRRKNRQMAMQARRELAERRRNGTDDDDEPDLEEDEVDGDDDDDGVKLNKRGDINILLVGDPGTSKSQLLGYVHKLSPRGVYTSGKGSSAVGLTASVVRDPETRELVMESGALVLSDLGICCIDEFDKMSATTRAILHEAMEQQTVSIAKAGIIATLNARTSILASANPVESRYNPSLSVVENIQLPPTLLSRFDLIYLILDSPNVSNDRMLAQHLVGLYYETPNVVEPPLDHGLLRDYIAYARENVHPELSDLASRELISAYIEMRRGGSGGSGGRGRTITATPRQLESLIRLSESLARMKYATVVTRDDVREAVRLMKVATQAAATDPRTGRIDMDMITTGRSTAERELEENLAASLRELLVERRGNRLSVSEIRRQLSEILNAQVQQEDLTEILKVMDADGLVQYNERAQTVFVRAGVVG